MRSGATNFITKPIEPLEVVEALRDALSESHPAIELATSALDIGPHAGLRWVRALLPIVYATRDPKTLTVWSRLVYASPGTLRNWCRTAGIAPRRSLVFARLLRVTLLNPGGRHQVENLLDVADRRTLRRMLNYAGFRDECDLPNDVQAFLSRQILVRDRDTLMLVARALTQYPSSYSSPLSAGARIVDGIRRQT
jgi:hypothetical protein